MTQKILYLRRPGLVRNSMNITPDRRIKPRVTCDYPVLLEGYDAKGNKYSDNGKLANLSASGLFLLTSRCVENGSSLSVVVILTSAFIEKDTPRISTNGIVVRTEPQKDGSCGVAVKFNSYKFI